MHMFQSIQYSHRKTTAFCKKFCSQKFSSNTSTTMTTSICKNSNRIKMTTESQHIHIGKFEKERSDVYSLLSTLETMEKCPIVCCDNLNIHFPFITSWNLSLDIHSTTSAITCAHSNRRVFQCVTHQ